ncbi:MAG TPA: glutamate-cysteine ligase family protein, partial [Acidimicrobiia bacterium]|nr:glutamate-cysteine ligase family protein [Acidimicrobiia bacterium]
PARAEADEDPAATWARYALGARVMLVRHDPERFEPVLHPLTFGQWAAGGRDGRFPTLDDLEYHLTTLFPPVRLRGWLELRMIDALPDPWWQVPVAVAVALLGDTGVAAEAQRATAPVAGLWRLAARHGLAHPALHEAAWRCFALALEALAGSRDADLVPVVAAYRDRFVAPGRCPADDSLDAWARHGGPLPALEAAAN